MSTITMVNTNDGIDECNGRCTYVILYDCIVCDEGITF